jgi:hypothetical protein
MAGTNGTSRKMRVAGACLDCMVPSEITELRNLLDHTRNIDFPELAARIEKVADHSEERDVAMQELYSKFELTVITLQQHVEKFSRSSEVLSKTLERIGIRRIADVKGAKSC